MKPEELVKYLEAKNQDDIMHDVPEVQMSDDQQTPDFKPMDPKMATGQMPGIPALPGLNMAEGGEVESPLIVKLREMMMGKPIMADVDTLNQANSVDPSTSTVQGMAKGGVVQNIKDFVKKTYEKAQKGPLVPDSTLQGFQNMTKKPPQPPVPTPPPQNMADGGVAFNPQSGLPPVDQYYDQQHQQANQYSPADQAALQQQLLAQRQSLGSRGAQALGGFADALMQGVARSGNPGFKQGIVDQQDKAIQQAQSILPEARQANLQNLKVNEDIDKTNPTSAVSQYVQRLYGPLNKTLGLPQGLGNEEQLGNITKTAAEVEKAKSEAALAGATLGLNREKHNTEVQHQKAEEAAKTEDLKLKGTEDRRKQLEEVAKHPLLHPINAFNASKELADGISASPAPSITSKAEYDALPPGTQYTFNGVPHRKK